MLVRLRPRLPLTGLLLLLALCVAVALSACSKVPGVYTYASDKSGAASSDDGSVDPKTYVNENWAAKIVPTVHDKAVDVTTLAAAIAANPDAAGKQYGHQSGTGSPWSFLAKGTGTVTKVDSSAPTGPVTIQVPADSGGKAVTVTLATGPVIAGTALRDAVGFIEFGQFTNQIDYADVANLINDKVKTQVVSKVDVKSLVGKKVSFYGAFANLAPGTVFLVPTQIEVG